MNRQDILEFINDVINEEHGEPVQEDSLLIDCKIDSFGYAIFWTSLEAKYSIELGKKVMKVDYSTLHIKDVIDMVIENVSK